MFFTSAPVLLAISNIEPSYLIAALFLIGLGIVFMMQLRHYRRMERLAQEMYVIRDLKDELSAISQTFKKMEFERIVALLEETRDIMMKLEQNMTVPVVGSQPIEQTSTPQERDLYSEIDRHLSESGYQNISYLADIVENQEGACRLPVEAYKEGAAYKGYVVIKNGAILSARMNPSFKAFP